MKLLSFCIDSEKLNLVISGNKMWQASEDSQLGQKMNFLAVEKKFLFSILENLLVIVDTRWFESLQAIWSHLGRIWSEMDWNWPKMSIFSQKIFGH